MAARRVPSWAQLHAALERTGTVPKAFSPARGEPRQGVAAGRTVPDGGDGPAWSRKRDGYRPPPNLVDRAVSEDFGMAARAAYAELHCHSNFSFLDGASGPEQLVEQAAALGLDAVALTDHDNLSGVVRFADAARELGVRTVFGAELSLGLREPQGGVADPMGEHLLVLARGVTGYRRLCRVITSAFLRSETKGLPLYDPDEVVEELAGHAVVLTGCRKGAVRRALAGDGPAAAARALSTLIDRFGRDSVAMELIDLRMPGDDVRNDLLAAIAADTAGGVMTVATNAVHYAVPEHGRLAAAVAAVRARRSLEEMAGWLPPAATACLLSADEMAARMRRYPGAVHRAAVLGVELAFDLQLVAPTLPPFPVPAGHTESSWLRVLTMRGAADRYGPPDAAPDAYRQLEHELAVIARLDFPGYFLIVWDIVRFCEEQRIFCQGRGSAANSAVCYALGITNVDAVRYDLLFERFLSTERDGPPDIDVDIESDRREEVIQYVYGRHGRRRAALVANVISYRPRLAVRDMAAALGYSPGQRDAWSKSIDRWGSIADVAADPDTDIPPLVLELAGQLEGAPRHLGIHPGGMVICDRPVSEVCPVEHARMPGRTVLQWDKDDCAAIGLVKFDLLGLGMLSAVHYAIDLVADHEGVVVDRAQLDLADPAVYDMLCAADTIGVFQVESRAQIGTLPRLKPRTFWDLAVEIALIRPGPIQGGAVHPYLARRNGKPWQHDHPLLAHALDRTLGVPLFQEQVMQIAVDVAGFSPGEADALRRAMGSKRSGRKMAALRERFHAGAAANGVNAELAERIYEQVRAFANYGFPMSHALSFAHLVFVSSYLKLYHPAAFLAGLLRAQPMGFYSPQSLVTDAQRHGVVVHPVDITRSLAHATLEPDPVSAGGQAVRLGLGSVRGLGDPAATRIADHRATDGAYRDLTDLARRVDLDRDQLEALATAGALAALVPDRRRALWMAGAAARDRATMLAGTTVAAAAPALPGMTALELITADATMTGISAVHPVAMLRQHLTELGALPANQLAGIQHGTRVHVGGVVTHRQRPATAGGVTFLNLEDETGMTNIVVSPGLWARHRQVVRNCPALLVRGILESSSGAINLVADQLTALDLGVVIASRDFR